ncbi:MAG: heterodisulfide reductase-related iron-sulfur binding cluster [Candidatus Bathyarchaeia archaeon]
MRVQQTNPTVMMFWGCMIPTVEPYVEKATRYSLERLGVKVVEMYEATCCPDPEISRTMGVELWRTLAGRNISIANRSRNDICVICNGCFDTLTKVDSELKTDVTLSERVNDVLKRYGMEYDGSSRIYHMIEFLHDVVGVEKLAGSVEKSLSGLKCAPQYGCRILGDKSDMRMKFDRLITLTGGEIVHTKTERLCCGVPAMYSDPDFALHQRAKVKLEDIKVAGADCIVLFCPACAERIERAEVALAGEGIEFDIPVLNYLELLAICLGASPTDIGIHLHRVSVDPIVERILKAYEE